MKIVNSANADLSAKAKVVRRPWHIICLVLSVSLWTTWILRVVCKVKNINDIESCPDECPAPQCNDPDSIVYCSGICDTYVNHWFLPLIITLPILYILESLISRSWKCLLNEDNLTEFKEYITKVRNTPPGASFDISCYHYEKSTRTVTDSEGNMKEESVTERVVTYSSCEKLSCLEWEDLTGEIMGIEGQKLLKVHFLKKIQVSDVARNNFEGEKAKVMSANRHRDEYMDSSSLQYTIGECIDHILVRRDDIEKKPPCLRWEFFWMWTFLLLSWPYRMYLEFMTVTKEIRIHKNITK